MLIGIDNLTEPWVDVPTARCVLGWLVMGGEFAGDGSKRLSEWLIYHGLGAFAYGRCGADERDLRRFLQGDMFSAAAESSLKQSQLKTIFGAFAEAQVALVVLKGAALSVTVYDDSAWRTMSDIDVWVQDADIATAANIMVDLGYKTNVVGERPLALQQMMRGEIEYMQPAQPNSLVEVHWSPFVGWWLMRTAAVDEAALWAQRVPLGDGIDATLSGDQLSAEDMVIHLAVHMAVNHQFGLSALRGLVDIALTAEKRGVDWVMVAERAKQWRVGTAVYTVLSLFDQLIGITGVGEALKQLKPAALRLRLIRRFVTPESVLRGRDIQHGWQRFLLLLLLVDRPRDMVKLILRTLWPEQVWLEARYGGNVGHWMHLWRVVRYREV